MKTAKLFFGILFSIAVAACGDGSGGGEKSAGVPAPVSATATITAQNFRDVPPAEAAASTKPDPRMLVLQLIAPPTAQAGVTLVGISVSLLNPGTEAPNARLRLIIHDKDHRSAVGHRELSPDNVKVEVQEGGAWKPVILGMVEGGVMGAIGTEGVASHRERHRRGGFAIPAGLNKTWQLRLTFGLPGTYSLVSAVSPDNGSRHLAQPAHTIIEVQ
ncbi:MAG TPA: hypothetical protein VMV48_11110 [Gallionellaceae bacterium]|nr:hypothetical protein [Gallionellaceae bacterium]